MLDTTELFGIRIELELRSLALSYVSHTFTGREIKLSLTSALSGGGS